MMMSSLVKQMIGKKKFWTSVRQSWHTIWSIAELKIVLDINNHRKMQIDCLQLFHSSTKDLIISDEILSIVVYSSGLSSQDWKRDFKPLMLWDIPAFQEQPLVILARVCFSFKNSCAFVGQFRLKRNSHYCPKVEFISPSQKPSLSGPQLKLWLKINQKNMVFTWGTESRRVVVVRCSWKWCYWSDNSANIGVCWVPFGTRAALWALANHVKHLHLVFYCCTFFTVVFWGLIKIFQALPEPQMKGMHRKLNK